MTAHRPGSGRTGNAGTHTVRQPFTPLALTRELPFLPLAQDGLDYQVDSRGRRGLIDTLLGKTGTKVLLVRNGLLAVPRGQGRMVDYQAIAMRLALVPGDYMRHEVREHPGAFAMYLGVHRGVRDEHYIAVDITRVQQPTRVPDAMHVGADDAFERPDAGTIPVIDHAWERFDWVDLRGFAPHASALQAGLATTAVALSRWQNSQRFCPCCGARVDVALAGWAQRCTNEHDGRRILFPRVEPAVITAIVDGEDRLLLQHNTAWHPGFYSVCAGFVEAGENLEHAVRREAREETGIPIGEVRYLGSQPWPFPASLMVAFKALALSDDICVDHRETAEARWVTRGEFTAGMADGSLEIPGRASVARYMIGEWYGRPL